MIEQQKTDNKIIKQIEKQKIASIQDIKIRKYS